MYFFEEHPVIATIISVILIFAILFGIIYAVRGGKNILFNGNRQVFDTNYQFSWAIIELGNGELLEGAVKTWNDYSDSDAVQIVMEDGTIILTHYSKVLLCSKRP